ncbi:hypothetical protein V8F06_008906 [Rhypophila decipiens]
MRRLLLSHRSRVLLLAFAAKSLYFCSSMMMYGRFSRIYHFKKTDLKKRSSIGITIFLFHFPGPASTGSLLDSNTNGERDRIYPPRSSFTLSCPSVLSRPPKLCTRQVSRSALQFFEEGLRMHLRSLGNVPLRGERDIIIRSSGRRHVTIDLSTSLIPHPTCRFKSSAIVTIIPTAPITLYFQTFESDTGY